MLTLLSRKGDRFRRQRNGFNFYLILHLHYDCETPMKRSMRKNSVRSEKATSLHSSTSSQTGVAYGSSAIETATWDRKTYNTREFEASVGVGSTDLATHIEHRHKALTVSELADILSLSKQQIYSLVQRGQIPSIKIAGSIRLDPVATANWLRSLAA